MKHFRDFNEALEFFRLSGGAMNYGHYFPGQGKCWIVGDYTEINKLSDYSPRTQTVLALHVGGFTDEMVEEELSDWRDIDIDLSYLWISYLKNGERLICWNDGTGNPIDSWIICHPENGEIIASSEDEDAAHELFAVDEIFYGIINSLHMNQDQLTPGLMDSIITMWPSTERTQWR